MAPQWMPQNLQKRLLRYVLQQLSLFSEIDLPNLDVSLGTNSRVNLRDVQLDPEKISLPGVYVRGGKVADLTLVLTVSDGVNIEANGVEVTIAPSVTNHTQDPSKSQISLAQSLANSVMFADEQHSPSLDESLEIPSGEKDDKGETYLGNMMNRAVEIALAKLQVEITNIKVTIILDPFVAELRIAHVWFASEDGVRKVDFEGVELLLVKPTASEGDTCGETDTIPPSSDENSDVDTDSDDDMQEMERSGLMESALFEQQENSSIYMSATSNVVLSSVKPVSEKRHPTRLMYIKDGFLSFRGLADIENLEIDIGCINVALVPLPTAIVSLFESLSHTVKLSKLQRKWEGSKSGAAASEIPDDDNDYNESIPLEKVTISEINLSFTSSILACGDFADSNSLRVVLSEVFYGQKKKPSCHGVVKSIKIVQNANDIVFEFEDSHDASDLRFESLKSDIVRSTLLCSKPAVFNLNQGSLSAIMRFYHQLLPCLTAIDAYNKNKTKKSFVPARKRDQQKPLISSELNFQTATLFVNLLLDEKTSVKMTVFPISYSSSSGVFETDKVLVEDLNQADEDYMSPFLMTTKIEFKIYAKEQQVKSFDHNSQEVALFTSSKLTVDSVNLTCAHKRLMEIQSAISAFIALLPPTPETKGAKKMRMGSTMFLHAKSLGCFALFRQIDICVTSVSDKFGDLKASVKPMCVNFYKEGSLHGFLVSVAVGRMLGMEYESLLGVTNSEETNSPLVTFRIKEPSIVNVSMRNLTFSYYAQWLSYLERNSSSSSKTAPSSRSNNILQVRISLSDIVIGLIPVYLASRGNLVVRKGTVDISSAEVVSVKATLRSISLLLIDDYHNILSDIDSKRYRQWLNFSNSQATTPTWTHVSMFQSKGYVLVGSLNSLYVGVTLNDERTVQVNKEQSLVDLDFNADVCTFDLCADSAQCMLQLFKDLKETITIPFEDKYKVATEPINIFEDVVNEFFTSTAKGFQTHTEQLEHLKLSRQGSADSLNLVESYFDGSGATTGSAGNAGSVEASSTHGDGSLRKLDVSESYFSLRQESSDPALPIYFYLGVSKVIIRLFDGFDWRSTRATIEDAVKRVERRAADNEDKSHPPEIGDFDDVAGSADSVVVDNDNDDEYDEDYDEGESDRGDQLRVIQERIYESIHVALPVGADPLTLPSGINRELMSNDRESTLSLESSSSTVSAGSRRLSSKLNLKRSKFHKVAIDASGFEFKMSVFQNGDLAIVPTEKPVVFVDDEFADDSELLNTMRVRIRDLQIIDNVPTSTWNKFFTYMREAGDREVGTSMVDLTLNTIKPVPELAATEMSIKVSVLPVRLHVDQDTLDFLTRFGEFKDERFLLPYEDEDAMFIQKISINAVKVKLDYKPKKIDYAGIRSGHTNEFMNFFILDEARMTLKSIVLYGVPGFPRLNTLLNNSWMPDIKATQLSGVLAGLAPVKSIVKIGSGFKDLVAIPIKEYEKDGRVIRSLQKGAYSFAKTTGSELLKFGVKLATGTQTILENAEGAMGDGNSRNRTSSSTLSTRQRRFSDGVGDEEFLFAITDRATLEDVADNAIDYGNYDEIESDDEDYNVSRNYRRSRRRSSNRHRIVEPPVEDEAKAMSLYSNQPSNVQEGIKHAMQSFGKNINTAKEAVSRASTRAAESSTAREAAMEIAKAAPIMMIRPMIGTTEAISKALLGGINNLDPEEKLKAEEKYKRT